MGVSTKEYLGGQASVPKGSSQTYAVDDCRKQGGAASLWVSRVPPMWFLFLAAIMGIIALIAAIFLATRVSWLGIQVAPDPQGIRVIAVSPDGPSNKRLLPGDVLVALVEDTGQVTQLSGDSLLREPEYYSTYAQVNQFFDKSEELFRIMQTPEVTVIVAGGREVRIPVASVRPIGDLPARFWIVAVPGVLVLLIGIAIWAFSRDQIATRLVGVSGVGYLISALSVATSATREWIFPPDLLWWLEAGRYAGNMICNFSMMAVLWYYPRRLGQFPMATAVFVVIVLLWLNMEVFQLVEWPLHTFRAQFALSVVLAAWFLRGQWAATQARPDERAVLPWFALTLLAGAAIVIASYVNPNVFIAKPACQLRNGLLYAGLVVGILRFGLFDLDRWWFAIWSWFFGGLAVVVVDFVLVYYANLQQTATLAISLLLVSWLYFPVRQWAWSRFVRSTSQQLESHLPLLLETFFASSDQVPVRERWEALLRRNFDPLSIRAAPGYVSRARLEENGLSLAVPDMEGETSIVLSGRSRGSRLFTREDVQLVSVIQELARKSAAICEARNRGTVVERERIARDLHDDVVPRLLMLTYGTVSPERAERARLALQTLRESIYALSDPRSLPIEETLAEWRREAFERLQAAGVRLIWKQQARLPVLGLNVHRRMNLGRVLREALTNALRHASPSRIVISVRCSKGNLMFRMVNDGHVADPGTWSSGKGINNMRIRIAEVDGCIRWRTLSGGKTRLQTSWMARFGPLDRIQLPT